MKILMKNSLGTFTGVVIEGEGVAGPVFGAPTANIQVTRRCDLEHGVYAVVVEYNTWKFHGALSYGGPNPKFEVHLLNFEGDLVGREFTIHVIEKVSEYFLWSSKERLRQKIIHDIQLVREVFDKEKRAIKLRD